MQGTNVRRFTNEFRIGKFNFFSFLLDWWCVFGGQEAGGIGENRNTHNIKVQKLVSV